MAALEMCVHREDGDVVRTPTGHFAAVGPDFLAVGSMVGGPPTLPALGLEVVDVDVLTLADVRDDAAVCPGPYLITVIARLQSRSASLWPIGTACFATRRKSELSWVTTQSISVPAATLRRPRRDIVLRVVHQQLRNGHWSASRGRAAGMARGRSYIRYYTADNGHRRKRSLTMELHPEFAAHGRVATLPAPLQQVYDFLVKQIAAGEWGPGESLPSEQALAGRLNVSQGTVRKALDSLAADSLIDRRQGKEPTSPSTPRSARSSVLPHGASGRRAHGADQRW